MNVAEASVMIKQIEEATSLTLIGQNKKKPLLCSLFQGGRSFLCVVWHLSCFPNSWAFLTISDWAVGLSGYGRGERSHQTLPDTE